MRAPPSLLSALDLGIAMRQLHPRAEAATDAAHHDGATKAVASIPAPSQCRHPSPS